MDSLLEAMARAADALVDFLERKRGLHRKRHQDHLAPATAIVKTVMANYFRRQGEAVLRNLAPHLRARIEQFSEADKKGSLFADTLIPDSFAPLRFAALPAEDLMYNEALSAAIDAAGQVLADEMGIGAIETPRVASDYLRDNSLSKLTGEIADTTKDRLRSALADAWEAGGSYEQVVDAIQSTVETFSDVRAGMIANQEVGNAYLAGRRATATAAGLSEKSSEVESDNPCPTCIENEDAGWIPIDDLYPSGDDAPLFHVNCQCLENYRG